jgi:hypothetical protein
LVLNSSLPQGGTKRTEAYVIAQAAGYNCDAAIWTSKNTVIAGGPHVTPAGPFQRFYDVADL